MLKYAFNSRCPVFIRSSIFFINSPLFTSYFYRTWTTVGLQAVNSTVFTEAARLLSGSDQIKTGERINMVNSVVQCEKPSPSLLMNGSFLVTWTLLPYPNPYLCLHDSWIPQDPSPVTHLQFDGSSLWFDTIGGSGKGPGVKAPVTTTLAPFLASLHAEWIGSDVIITYTVWLINFVISWSCHFKVGSVKAVNQNADFPLR